MDRIRRMTIELVAPIERVWASLADAEGWAVGAERSGTVTVVGTRAPDRVSWHVTGRVLGAVQWELDDLDALVFVHGTWEVGPARTHVRVSEKAAQRAHDGYADTVARQLARTLDVDLLTIRSDMRRPRQPWGRPRTGEVVRR